MKKLPLKELIESLVTYEMVIGGKKTKEEEQRSWNECFTIIFKVLNDLNSTNDDLAFITLNSNGLNKKKEIRKRRDITENKKID